MSDQPTELQKRDVLRMSNEESNRLTRECLQTALIQLMSEKPFDQISITELVRRSGVSRTAFYRNYTSKEMILTEMSDAFIQILTTSLSDIKKREDSFQWYRRSFQIVYKNAKLFQLLLDAHVPLYQIVGSYIILEKIMPSSTSEEHYRLVALETGFAAILADWFRRGMKESIDFMAEFCADQLPILE